MKPNGYWAYLMDAAGKLHVYRAVGPLDLTRTNVRPARCVECGFELLAGDGVYRGGFGKAGFVCLKCGRNSLVLFSKQGYSENMCGVLHSCHYEQGTWTAEQVAKSICPVEA